MGPAGLEQGLDGFSGLLRWQQEDFGGVGRANATGRQARAASAPDTKRALSYCRRSGPLSDEAVWSPDRVCDKPANCPAGDLSVELAGAAIGI